MREIPSLFLPYEFLSRAWRLNRFTVLRPMTDLLMIFCTVAFFAVAVLYVVACERLR